MPFEFETTPLEGCILIKPKKFSDVRGYFKEIYKKTDFVVSGISSEFVQDNLSYSVKNVIRGLHFQKPPKEQSKLVFCVYGEIFDVAVDLRKNSKTYLKWYGVSLNHENGYMFYIPKGFAHGFIVRSDFAIVCYKCDEEYSPQHECGIRYNDPTIKIDWGVDEPILSQKDLKLPFLHEIEEFL